MVIYECGAKVKPVSKLKPSEEQQSTKKQQQQNYYF